MVAGVLFDDGGFNNGLVGIFIRSKSIRSVVSPFKNCIELPGYSYVVSVMYISRGFDDLLKIRSAPQSLELIPRCKLRLVDNFLSISRPVIESKSSSWIPGTFNGKLVSSKRNTFFVGILFSFIC